mmetsp:Transcript_100711/g.170278  ORF Transcript_100711/g.170278 Transcript_100711/m.170278 type:complete len:148 (+) Transcript_100711:1029-1472(+)
MPQVSVGYANAEGLEKFKPTSYRPSQTRNPERGSSYRDAMPSPADYHELKIHTDYFLYTRLEAGAASAARLPPGQDCSPRQLSRIHCLHPASYPGPMVLHEKATIDYPEELSILLALCRTTRPFAGRTPWCSRPEMLCRWGSSTAKS